MPRTSTVHAAETMRRKLNRQADRAATAPGRILAELLRHYSASYLLEALARAVELGTLSTLDESVELASTIQGSAAAAMRRVARGIEAAEERRRLA